MVANRSLRSPAMATTDSISPLPRYPSTTARKALSPSQRATLNQTISSSLLQTIALPPTKRDTPATRAFLASYSKDTALQTLDSLIWDNSSTSTSSHSKDEKIIRKRARLLAEKLASSEPGLDIPTLIDISVIYASTNISSTRTILLLASKANSSLSSTIESELAPAFTILLSSQSAHSLGLYGIRKAAHCISSFLHASPPEFIRPFAQSKTFVLALATIYDQGLTSVAHSYGGLSALQSAESRELDDWERIWVETKVSLMDTFHAIITVLLDDLSSASGTPLAMESERTFDIIFNLLELPTSSSFLTPSIPSTPFLNRSLLSDYQQSYDLSSTLARALQNAVEKDARLDLLESSLNSLDSSSSKTKDAGILKLILRSSGVPPGVDNLGRGNSRRTTDPSNALDEGKSRAPSQNDLPALSTSNPHASFDQGDIDMKITQVLDILPEHSPEYIRALLQHPSYPFAGSAEKVIEALLEGTAPPPEDVEATQEGNVHQIEDVRTYVEERHNVFDDDLMDLSQLRVGKKRGEDETAILRDRSFIEEMKADILRRAEAISDDEGEDDEAGNGIVVEDIKEKKKHIELAFDEDADLDGASRVKIVGDGEESNEEDEEDDEDEGPGATEPIRRNPETILELAYISNPKLFDRDGATKRSKARNDLKAQTGWSDEQIEGWKIMLEKNPRKDKILQKHEFAGNQNAIINPTPVAQGRGSSRGGARGRGGRGGGGGGRGRGGGGGAGEGSGASGEGSTRERAWKDKNKASRANHNRKRGHDKKMARAGGPS